MQRDKLIQALVREYREMYPRSESAHRRAKQILVDGISHGARLFKPYPFRVVAAHGARVTDLDGHSIIDFWQGHYANILGHNPDELRQALVNELQHGLGLQTGLPEERQTSFAETLARAVGAERVRLTTSGTLATMYALMLARAFTKRTLVVKIGGGWHGANPLALKGIARRENGFKAVDSAGVSPSADQEIIVTRFNDVEALQALFEKRGEEIACFILEPCPGQAGFIPATPEYMNAARRLTREYGALLILDEIITGFRYCAGGVQRLYGVRADLSTFGKIVGGGMPLSAVAGRADVMELASEEAQERVWFNGGTFSAHPLALLAGEYMINYLTTHEKEIYPRLAEKGSYLRHGIERAFADRGVLARCTGHGNAVIAGGSLGTIYFPLRPDTVATSPEDLTDPALCDTMMREQALKLGLLLHKVNVVHGLGALSMAHTREDLDHVIEACDAFAKRVRATRSNDQ